MKKRKEKEKKRKGKGGGKKRKKKGRKSFEYGKASRDNTQSHEFKHIDIARSSGAVLAKRLSTLTTSYSLPVVCLIIISYLSASIQGGALSYFVFVASAKSSSVIYDVI